MPEAERYVCFKHIDLDAALSDEDKRAFELICEKVNRHRKLTGRQPIQGVVIENDWPEYGPTMALLKERIDISKLDKDHPDNTIPF